MAAVRKYAPWEVVARIAGRVVGKHEDDVRVGYAETFHRSIPAYHSFRRGYSLFGEGHAREAHIPNAFAICYHSSKGIFRCKIAYSGTTDAYAVIEPVPRCTDKNCPVICVQRLGCFSGDIAVMNVMLSLDDKYERQEEDEKERKREWVHAFNHHV